MKAELIVESAQKSDSCVIWLHGLGADQTDFEPVARMLQKQLPNTRFILPQAPVQAVTVNGNYLMPSWYDILRMEQETRVIDLAQLQQSCNYIVQLIEQQIARGIEAKRIVLAGFSQGGAVTLHTAFCHWQGELAGVLALSTYAPAFTADNPFVTQKRPTLCMHGIYDDVVSPTMGKRAAQQLADYGYAVRWLEYPMQHEVSLSQIKDIARFLQEQLIETA